MRAARRKPAGFGSSGDGSGIDEDVGHRRYPIRDQVRRAQLLAFFHSTMEDPLLTVIRKLELIRDACYVCDRVPLDDMISDLRRWAKELAPERPEIDVPTVRERPNAAASAAKQLKARTG